MDKNFPRTTGQPGAADAAVDSAGAAVPFEELRAGTDPPDGYAGVPRGKRTTRPRDLPGAGRRVSPMLGILGQSFYTPIDRQGSGRVAK